MNLIGIVQGRLSPPLPDRLQGFPWQTWEQEFEDARRLGFDAIEWVFDAERAQDNPLRHAAGRARIRQRSTQTGLRVYSVCADYFLTHPFFRVTPAEQAKSVQVLLELIGEARAVGSTTVLLPVLEDAEIRSAQDRTELIAGLQEPLALVRSLEMQLGIETELPVIEYLALIEQIGHPFAKAYYDVGNAAAKGYAVDADVRRLSAHLGGVHIKDRLLGGPSVPLGQGAVDFPRFFEALGEIGYAGPIVLQTAFGTRYREDAATHLEFVRRHLGRRAEGAEIGVPVR